MPKFNISAEFSLGTTLEPNLYAHTFDTSSVDDFSNESYFGATDAEVSGGVLTFTVEAEDEAEAERKAEDVIYEGREVEDENGLVWAVSYLNLDVTAVEMSKDEALVVVRRFLDGLANLPREVREAFDVLLNDI